MKIDIQKIFKFSFAVVISLTTTIAHAFGVEEVYAPDAGDKPLALRIWYPNVSSEMNAVKGDHLPLVVISHGTGGSKESHEDTARALADAGFVVAAVTHTGDNYKDLSYIRERKQLVARPKHIVHTIDYMLTAWRAHRQIDAARIGIFGMSAGGFTALVLAGGQPDLKLTEAYCRTKPTSWSCNYLRKNGVSVESITAQPASAWTHDTRIKAAVIAAPAVGYSFEPNGLANVRIPIQLWSGEHDVIVDESPDTLRKLLPALTEDHRISGAGHFSFLAPCNVSLRAIIAVRSWFGTERICSDPEGFDRQRFHDEFNASIVKFLSGQLNDN